MKQKKTAVIFVFYNAMPWLRACLDSLREQTTDDFAIYAVDNNSSDETCEVVEKEYPEVRLIKSDKNLGFAGGNNKALRKAYEDGCEYFVLLNQDTVVQPNFIEAGEAMISREDVGLCSPKLLYKENDTIWWAGSKLYRGSELLMRPLFQIAEHVDKKKPDSDASSKEFVTDYIPGTSLFIKHEILEKVGYLDEEFFMYSEDLDYSLRVKDAGYKLLYFVTTMVYHDTPFSKQGKRPTFKRIFFKYKNYFLGVKKIVDKHFTLWEKVVWYVKLPVTLTLTLIYEVL